MFLNIRPPTYAGFSIAFQRSKGMGAIAMAAMAEIASVGIAAGNNNGNSGGSVSSGGSSGGDGHGCNDKDIGSYSNGGSHRQQ